jgi:hypothetical protein
MTRKPLTLLDLKNKINFTFDVYDDEISASLYFELDEVPDNILNRIEVVSIGTEQIVCRLTEFIREETQKYPNRLANYLTECNNDQVYLSQFFDEDDIANDGGEALYLFIEYDLYDYLTGRCG